VEVSLTDFVDFTIKTGPAKVTKVREIKNRHAYEPAVDFWRPLRDGIVDLHRAGRVDRAGLDAIIGAQTHAQKQRLYPVAADGYLRFLGRRPPDWLAPPRGVWHSAGLDVRVNPEIALRINDQVTVIKLYFKQEELTKPKVQGSIGVMVAELGTRAASGTQFGVLDVKNGRLFLPDGRWNPTDAQILIRGEARAFCEIWDAI
jgi:hypothetical protein